MEEIWKSIKCFESYYIVSNFGNVKNIITNKLFTKSQVARIIKHKRWT